MDQNWKEFIHKKHEEYKKIGHVECPAFNNEKIYFTQVGFSHLIRKARRIRDKSEQIRRMTLFQFAPGIIRRASVPKTDFVDIDEKGTRVQQWSFEARINGMNMTVIIEQINFLPKHFLSVFNDKPL